MTNLIQNKQMKNDGTHLKEKITDAVNRSYQKDLPTREFIKKNRVYWENESLDISSNNIQEFRIAVKNDDFFVFSNYILIFYDNVIKIYQFDESYVLKITKTLHSHLLTFYINRKAINSRVKNLFYRILVVLVKNNVVRLDSHLEGILMYLDIDNILDVKEYQTYFKVFYNDGNFRYFDERLSLITKMSKSKKSDKIDFDEIINVVSKLNNGTCAQNNISKVKSTDILKPGCIIKGPNKSIYVNKNSFHIIFDVGEIRKDYELKNIKSIAESKKAIFIGNGEEIRILSFE